MGKTAFCINVLEHIAIKKRIPTVMFSLENQVEGLRQRMISYMSGIELRKIRNFQCNSNEIKRLRNNLSRLCESPLYIIDYVSKPAPDNIRKTIKSYVKHWGIRFAVIDYIQHMSGKMKVKKELSALKKMAQDFNIPIMAISQLPRTVKKEDNAGRTLLTLRR